MDHKQVQKIADAHGLGKVHFHFNVAQNTGKLFEVGYVSTSKGRALFCKRTSDSNPDQFYLCNDYARLENKPGIDEKLAEIALTCLDVPAINSDNPFAEVTVKIRDLKVALELAYNAGRNSNEK